MPTSYSTGNHLHLLSLGARAARSYAAELPREAVTLVARLEVMQEEIATLNAQQEKAKQQLALLTRELKAKKTESMRERARLIRLAEATFGPRDPRIKEFRPATEGKVRTARGPNAERRAEKERAAAVGAPERAAPPLARTDLRPEGPPAPERSGFEPVAPEVTGREAAGHKVWMYPSSPVPLAGRVQRSGAAFTGDVCPFGCVPFPRGDGERESLRSTRERPGDERRGD